MCQTDICKTVAAAGKEQAVADSGGFVMGKAHKLGTGLTVPPDECIPDAKYVALGDSYSSGEGLAEGADARLLRASAGESSARLFT